MDRRLFLAQCVYEEGKETGKIEHKDCSSRLMLDFGNEA